MLVFLELVLISRIPIIIKEKITPATKTIFYDSVKLIFDPPSNSFLVTAIEKRMEEYKWRLNAQVDQPANNV